MPSIERMTKWSVCRLCGHEWVQRGQSKPRSCAGCKSPLWDREARKRGRKPASKRAKAPIKPAKRAKKPIKTPRRRAAARRLQRSVALPAVADIFA